MTPLPLDYRAAVRAALLAAAPADPELAARLAELRPEIEAWRVDLRPPRGLISLWAAICGAPTQVQAAGRYLSGAQTCTRDSQLAPPGWTVEQRKGGGRPRTRPAVPKRPVGRPRKVAAGEAGSSQSAKLSSDI